MLSLICRLVFNPLVVAAMCAAEEPRLTAEEKAAGFELLFNGRDLAGWEHNGKPGTFDVADGWLVGVRKKETAYWLSTKDEYADFELRLEYLIPPKGNSGIFIRAPRDGRTSQKGMEVQLYDEPGKQVPDKGSTGAIYQVAAPSKFAHHPGGQWNELGILCEGDRVRVTVNGQVVNDVNMSELEPLKNRPRKGYIGLSAHTDEVKFRNIRLRKIAGSQ